MIWFILIVIWFGCNALAAILAGARPPGRKSIPELGLFVIAQAAILAVLIRILVWLF
jgi:hypothetical protein